MKILFAGTPEIAVPCLEALAQKYDICAVLTRPDTKSGRGKKLVLSPVKQKAIDLDLPVLQPLQLHADARKEISAYRPDLLAVFAYSRIFGPRFLSLFPLGGINVHPSLLPKYRGPSPIQAAILNGDTETGISIQCISEEMDAGDILARLTLPLSGSETGESLSKTCAEMSAAMLPDVVDTILAGTSRPVPQDHSRATYCPLIQKEDGLIDWNSDASSIERKIRAYYPWPGGYTFFGENKLVILDAKASSGTQSVKTGLIPGMVLGMDKKEGILIQTGSGVLSLSRLQLQSRKAMDFLSFMNGTQDFIGSTLGGFPC